jgi:hypothetical protein
MRRAPIFFLLLSALLVPDCRCSKSSPEERVRQAIDTVVKAVNERQLKPVIAAISDQYSDDDGQTKEQLVGYVRAQFILRQNLYLVVKLSSLECPEPAKAKVVAFAAMAATSGGVLPDLRNLSADVYRFDIRMADEDGAWRVVGADWTPATVKDLL